MRTISKYAATAALTGALALAAATPSQARWHGDGWHNGAGAAIGFGIGAMVGAAAANSAYDNGYYYGDDGYAYAPDAAYAYDYAAPDYGYAYVPGPGWQTPSGVASHRGPGCIQSPGSTSFTGCDGN